MNKRRLLKLAGMLEADAANKKGIKFDMGSWGTVKNPSEPLSCGTSACAMGLAALSGAFKRQGLGYYIGWDGDINITMDGYPDDFDAAERLFDITFNEAEYLFAHADMMLAKGARGERLEAKRIREFVAAGGIPGRGLNK